MAPKLMIPFMLAWDQPARATINVNLPRRYRAAPIVKDLREIYYTTIYLSSPSSEFPGEKMSHQPRDRTIHIFFWSVGVSIGDLINFSTATLGLHSVARDCATSTSATANCMIYSSISVDTVACKIQSSVSQQYAVR